LVILVFEGRFPPGWRQFFQRAERIDHRACPFERVGVGVSSDDLQIQIGKVRLQLRRQTGSRAGRAQVSSWRKLSLHQL